MSSNKAVNIKTVKEIFKEMFKEQEKTLMNIVTNSTTLIHQSLDRLTMEIKDNNSRLEQISKETDDLKLSLETYQNINDTKIKQIEETLSKIRGISIENVLKDNAEMKEKIRELEDRSRRDNLRFDGIKEYQNESWGDTEEILKEALSNSLGIESVRIERAHRVGDPSKSKCRTIVAKFSSYKTKEYILNEARRQKISDIRIYEDFSKATVEIRKKNWEKVKELRKQNKYAVLVYDKIYTRDY